MREKEKIRADRVIAWVVVAVVHVGLGWMATRLPLPVQPMRSRDSSLEVVWIAAPRPLQRAARVRTTHRDSRLPVPAKAAVASNEQAPVRNDQPADAAQPEASRPLSAVFIQQAIAAAERQADTSFATDALANRTARLPGREANRFRMTGSRSPAGMVAVVGTLFGGAGYETNPCRSVRDSINDLSQAGDSRVLQDALDYEKRFCR